MFIQSAPEGLPRHAVTMHDHGNLSGQFARNFGNAEFEAPDPLDLVVYAIANHDAGWAAFDRDPATDPDTGLPYSVFATPARYILPTSKASPDYNERHHPYCGLLSSMHTWGIYNGRYGVSSEGRLNRLSPQDKPAVEAMLQAELDRQARLKAELSRTPHTAAWIEQSRLFQHYKLLQFCDLLAIYFNYTHTTLRAGHTFTHVPISPDRDTDVTITPAADGTYVLRPFPFAVSGAEFAYPMKLIAPGGHDSRGGWALALRATPNRWERVTLVGA
jgi:hypothetical protein